MPSKPSFTRDLPDVIAQLRASTDDWVDRKGLEELLRVSRSTAWRLMRQAGGRPGPGNTIVCSRLNLIAYFDRLLKGEGPVLQEVRRREKLASYLAAIRPQVLASRTAVAPASAGLALVNTRFDSLPSNVILTPRSLHLDFTTTEEFLAAVGAVIFALNNDFERVSAFISHQTSGT